MEYIRIPLTVFRRRTGQANTKSGQSRHSTPTKQCIIRNGEAEVKGRIATDSTVRRPHPARRFPGPMSRGCVRDGASPVSVRPYKSRGRDETSFEYIPKCDIAPASPCAASRRNKRRDGRTPLDASRGQRGAGASETARAPYLCDLINRAVVTRRPLKKYQSAILLQRCHAPPRDGINGATAAPRMTLPGAHVARVRQRRREPRLCATL